MKIVTFIITVVLTGCSTTNVDKLFDHLEFKEGEIGCVRMDGNMALGNVPVFSSETHVTYKKSKSDKEKAAPEC